MSDHITFPASPSDRETIDQLVKSFEGMFAPIDVEEATIRALPARPPKPMYTSFGGMNLHTYETYEVRDNLVAVEYSSGTINLTGAEARQFLRMLGDRRAAQFN